MECSTDASVAIWRCSQEALTNVLRHASCRKLTVTLSIQGPDVVVDVRDDGVGFDPGQPTQRLGLLGMRERAATLNGSVQVTSQPGETLISVRIPKRATL